MSDRVILQRVRLFLLVLSAFLCLGTLAELWLTEHTENPVQLLPFILCGAAFLVIVWALFRPTTAAIQLLRVVMLFVGLGSLFGLFEHIEHNIAFALEIQPNLTTADVFWDALGGANPLLAPGVLGITAVLALAAIYYHPALQTARK